MELFDRQSNSKKELLQALTRNGENIFSSDYIRKNNLPGQATLQRAVSGLISDGIVEKNNRKYFIADPFFRRFVRERT